MWYHSSNSNNIRPAEVDLTSSPTTVFVRKNFVLVPAIEGDNPTPEHWEYDERKMTKSEYELYADNVALRDYLDMIS